MGGNFRRWRDRKVVISKTVRFIFKVTMFDLLLKCSIIMCYTYIGTFGKIWMELRTLSEPYTENLRKIIVKFNNRCWTCLVVLFTFEYYIILYYGDCYWFVKCRTKLVPGPSRRRNVHGRPFIVSKIQIICVYTHTIHNILNA